MQPATSLDAPPWDPDVCGCGQALHYTQPGMEVMIRQIVARKGPMILVDVQGDPYTAYWVPRHFMALHRVTAANLVQLAEKYRLPKATRVRRM